MTKRPNMTAPEMHKHIMELGEAFNVLVLIVPGMHMEEALCEQLTATVFGMKITGCRIVVAPVTSPAAYACALHELGHACSPTGILGMDAANVKSESDVNILIEQEHSAWEWARHYALYWDTEMEQVATFCLTNYETKVRSTLLLLLRRVAQKPQPVQKSTWAAETISDFLRRRK